MSDATQGALIFAVILLAYFVPTAIAFLRHHQNRWPIAVLNFFLGWTVIGWIGMLAWSLSSKVASVRLHSTLPVDPAEQKKLESYRQQWEERDRKSLTD